MGGYPLIRVTERVVKQVFSPGSYAALSSQVPCQSLSLPVLHMPFNELWVTESHGCTVDMCSESHLTHTLTGQLHQNPVLVETCFFSFPSDSIQKTSGRLTCEGRKGA